MKNDLYKIRLNSESVPIPITDGKLRRLNIFYFFIFYLFLTRSSAVAFAANEPITCDGPESCEALLQYAKAQLKQFEIVNVDWEQSATKLTYYGAIEYCEKRGEFLPTARQWAKYYQSRNDAIKTLETAHSNESIDEPKVLQEIDKNKSLGFKPIFKLKEFKNGVPTPPENSEANDNLFIVIDFYYNSNDFPIPTDFNLSGNEYYSRVYWSRSAFPRSGNAYPINLNTGQFELFPKESKDDDSKAYTVCAKPRHYHTRKEPTKQTMKGSRVRPTALP